MCPLCTLRYSATHADKHHMVTGSMPWTPTSASWSSRSRWLGDGRGRAQQAVLRFVSVSNRRGAISAKVELDVQTVRAFSGANDRAGRRQPGADDGAPSTPIAVSAKSVSQRATSIWSCAYRAASIPKARPGWGDVDALAFSGR